MVKKREGRLLRPRTEFDELAERMSEAVKLICERGPMEPEKVDLRTVSLFAYALGISPDIQIKEKP